MGTFDPQVVAEAITKIRQHLALLREQFSTIYPHEQLVSKDGTFYKGWLADALESDLKKLEQGMGISQADQKRPDGVH